MATTIATTPAKMAMTLTTMLKNVTTTMTTTIARTPAKMAMTDDNVEERHNNHGDDDRNNDSEDGDDLLKNVRTNF